MTKKTLNIFDSDFLGFYCNSIKKGEQDKTLEQCIEKCDDFISNINRYTKADYYIGYLTKGKCFRYNINPSYKANRKYINMPKYLQEIKQHLQEKHNFIYQEGYEADDLVISFKDQNPQYECIIVSPDKDILNLEGRHFNPRKIKFHETSKDEALEYFWNDMLIGQPGDGIKGIPGIGKVKAKEIVNTGSSYRTTYKQHTIFEAYLEYFGEYEGIKEFTKNYLSLKLVNTVQLETIKLNQVDKITSE